MRQGTTTTGYTYCVDEQVFNDMELLEMMADLETNPLIYGKITERILGKEEKLKLYECCRQEDGRVPINLVEKTLSEIMNGSKEGKNS